MCSIRQCTKAALTLLLALKVRGKLLAEQGNKKGAKGGGTWDSKSLRQQISYNEVEGEIEYA